MSDATEVEADVPKKGKLKGLFLAIVVMLIAAGGSFGVFYTGLIDIPFKTEAAKPDSVETKKSPKQAFVALDPLIVPLRSNGSETYLRIVIQLDVYDPYNKEAESLKPRLSDMLLSYLRALSPEDIEDENSLLKLRTHMLHRVRIVIGEGKVRDLLITEFVLN